MQRLQDGSESVYKYHFTEYWHVMEWICRPVQLIVIFRVQPHQNNKCQEGIHFPQSWWIPVEKVRVGQKYSASNTETIKLVGFFSYDFYYFLGEKKAERSHTHCCSH